MGCCGGFIGQVFNPVVETVVNPIVEPVIEQVVQPVVKAVEQTVQAALDNPLQTAAIATAMATGQTYLIPYINAGFALDAGQSPEKALQSAAISYAGTQVGGAVGTETGSTFAGNVAGGTTQGLLSGKPLEQSVVGGVTGGAISQVTPSTLLTSGGGQGTTGATNMAQEDFTFGYGGEGYEFGGVGSTPSPQDFTYGYGDLGYEGTGSAPYTKAEIDALVSQTYTSDLGTPSTLDAATQALLKRALAAGGTAAQGALNFLGQKGVAQGALGAVGSLRQIEADKQAAIRAQENLARATQQGVAGSQFRPVGTTTRFGTSNFQVDPTTGQLTSAGYTAAPEITSAQNRLMSLGSSYLAQTPEEVAQQYMTRQYDLLDPSRQRQLAAIRNQNFQTGRGGLSVGSTGLRPSGAQGLMGANPELEAYYNALAQQDAQLAAQAQQAGQQQVSFGTGLFGQAGQLEQLAQQPFALSQGLAEKSSLSGYRAGDLGYRGALAGGVIGRSAEATVNPYARALTGLADPASLLSQGIGQSLNGLFTNQFGGTPQGGQAQLGQYMAGAIANPQSQQARMLAEQEAAFRGTDNYTFNPMYSGGYGGYA
jgi:hypothetical protein